MTIIACIIQHQIIASPLREHVEFLDEAEEELIDDAAEELEPLLPPREVVNGMSIGTVDDIREMPDGTVRGPAVDADDEEPSNESIDTLLTVDDFHLSTFCRALVLSSQFALDERVFVWWWGLWWRGTVHHIARVKGTLTIRWDWSKKTTCDYLPRLLQKE